MFGLLKKIVFLPINSERTSRNSLSPLAAQNKDLDAASLFADLTLASHADVLREGDIGIFGFAVLAIF